MNAETEAVARAIWETWRASPLVTDACRDVDFDALRSLAAKYPNRAPGITLRTAFDEADAAIRAIETETIAPARARVAELEAALKGMLRQYDLGDAHIVASAYMPWADHPIFIARAALSRSSIEGERS